ncbi:hypothetical protein F5Y13DRAFT_158229 [Hypoxylon sp. FL1857]|nr:hypothetical protein F5Y13DRAFT_158229 [Hypoxylon sp. FL1857]
MMALHMSPTTWVVPNSDRVVSELIAKRQMSNPICLFLVISLAMGKKHAVIRQEYESGEGR